MDASGYREKAPQSVQEEDMRKLTALLEQLEVISEAEKKLDSNWVWPTDLCTCWRRPDCTEVGPHIFLVCKKLSYVLICSGLQLIVKMEVTLSQRVRIFNGYTKPYFGCSIL